MSSRNRVVLPEPLGPMIAIFWPDGTSSSIVRSTWTGPNALLTPRNLTIGSDPASCPAPPSGSVAGKARLQASDEQAGRVAQQQEDHADERQRLEIAVCLTGL